MGTLVDSNLRDHVVEVGRVNDCIMAIKIVVWGALMTVVSAYAP